MPSPFANLNKPKEVIVPEVIEKPSVLRDDLRSTLKHIEPEPVQDIVVEQPKTVEYKKPVQLFDKEKLTIKQLKNQQTKLQAKMLYNNVMNMLGHKVKPEVKHVQSQENKDYHLKRAEMQRELKKLKKSNAPKEQIQALREQILNLK